MKKLLEYLIGWSAISAGLVAVMVKAGSIYSTGGSILAPCLFMFFLTLILGMTCHVVYDNDKRG